MQEGSADAHLHYILAKTFEKVDSAGHPSVFAEGDQPVILFVCDFLVVDQTDVFLEQGVQSWHVMQLSLNHTPHTLIVCEK